MNYQRFLSFSYKVGFKRLLTSGIEKGVEHWEFKGIKLFSPEQFVKIFNNINGPKNTQPFVILDVRNNDEVNSCSLPTLNNINGEIPLIHIPLPEILSNKPLELPKAKTIICMCAKGKRGSTAMQFLETKGYECANIEGGLELLEELTVHKY